MGILDGKVAVITGAGSGMGRGSCEVFVREGARVVAADISGKQEQTVADIGGSDIVAFQCDVSKEDQVEAMIQAAISKFGRVDAVLNVGGIADGGPIVDTTEDRIDRIYAVNYKGVYWGTKYGLRAMKDSGGGSIVNWSSLAGVIPSPYSSVYSSLKAAVAHLTKCTVIEGGPIKVRANAICPGMVATEGMGNQALTMDPTKEFRAPIGRSGKPHEAGELAAFLSSDRGSFINGVVIPFDGGWHCRLAGDDGSRPG